MELTIDEAMLGKRTKSSQKHPIDLEKFSEDELLELRQLILEYLPASHLKDLDLEQELVLQFRQAQYLQSSILNNTSIPPNQHAQVMNSVNATLQHLVKMQSEFYTFERFKRIEGILVRLLNEWPEEQTAEFFRRYEAELAK